jgi:hypothetical protein
MVHLSISFQYQEDLNELNEMARHKPRANLVLGIAQENRQIRELQQENKELRMSLEEHQSALELIMSKYREQIFKLLMANKLDMSILNKDQSEVGQKVIMFLHDFLKNIVLSSKDLKTGSFH